MINNNVPIFARNVLDILRKEFYFDSSELLHINSIRHTYHNLSLKSYGTWNDNHKLLREYKKHYCTIRKEAYTCWGDIYKQNLKEMSNFPPASLFQYSPRNGFIYVEGNSNIAEKILNWICESHAEGDSFFTWKLKDVTSNDYFIHYPFRNISLLMLSNDDHQLVDIDITTRIFDQLYIIPSTFIIGNYNIKHEFREANRVIREKHYSDKYPSSKMIINEEYSNSNTNSNTDIHTYSQCITPNCRHGIGFHCFPSVELQDETMKIVSSLM